MKNKYRMIMLEDGNKLYILPNIKAVRKFLGEQIEPRPKPTSLKDWVKAQLGLPWTDKDKP
jgi:hypothetical protein